MAERLRLGIVDCDTSHVYQFSRRLNHVDIEPAQWVEGARVVAAFVGTSRVTAPERVEEYVAAMRATGVALVDAPEELLGAVDAVLIESNEGAVHRRRAEPFLAAGLPVFIDKPLAITVEDARAMADLAARHRAPLLSASSLRFAREIEAITVDEGLGVIRGADVHCPAPLHDVNPGLFHYGVHGVEMLYALLGAGCVEVSCTSEERGEVVVGRWVDGRLGVLRGLRGAASGYGFTAYGERSIVTRSIDATWIYKELVERIVTMARTGSSPVGAEELVEVVAFQEAALHSRGEGGAPVALSPAATRGARA